jgi:hypothetical protein
VVEQAVSAVVASSAAAQRDVSFFFMGCSFLRADAWIIRFVAMPLFGGIDRDDRVCRFASMQTNEIQLNTTFASMQ